MTHRYDRRTALMTMATTFGAAGLAASMPTRLVAAAPKQGVKNPGYHRIMVGELEMTALSDGSLVMPLADLYTGIPKERARAALAAAFQDRESETSVNAFLVNDGHRLILIDAGTGIHMGTNLGRLIENMAAAGYAPEQVDHVLLTHLHIDHSGGLINKGKAVFSNATVHVSKSDADFWLALSGSERPAHVSADQFMQAQECVAPYISASRFQPFEDNSEILDGVRAVHRPGHTPGHSAFVFESGGERLMIWGDVTHGDVLQFDWPNVAITFDVDQQQAIASRTAAFSEAADQQYLVAGSHLAFPGLGHVRRDASHYDWVPINYSAG